MRDRQTVVTFLDQKNRPSLIKIPPPFADPLSGFLLVGQPCPKISVPANSCPNLGCTELPITPSTAKRRRSSRSFEAVASRPAPPVTSASYSCTRTKPIGEIDQHSVPDTVNAIDHDSVGFAR
jgi:hypothetical protein